MGPSIVIAVAVFISVLAGYFCVPIVVRWWSTKLVTPVANWLLKAFQETASRGGEVAPEFLNFGRLHRVFGWTVTIAPVLLVIGSVMTPKTGNDCDAYNVCRKANASMHASQCADLMTIGRAAAQSGDNETVVTAAILAGKNGCTYR